ncbi:MAG: hypothetical protein OM95_04950 [Bdellovibrio sp. ArHS]|nr:MAG: hypothetical protein OM95_04950 [Bdellovibrio sp. ArHS]
MVLLSGCSFNAQILNLSENTSPGPAPVLSEKMPPLEVTPSSSQGVYTTGGYQAQVSISYYDAQPEPQTSSGYTVRTSLQSNLFKE